MEKGAMPVRRTVNTLLRRPRPAPGAWRTPRRGAGVNRRTRRRAGVGGEHTWYDPAGNRLLKTHDGARTTYSYDAANQLEWSEDASGRTTYTFDADGNQQLVVEPTGDRTTTSWDYENRTTLVQLPSGIRNTMAYEPGGLRMKLEESTGTKKFVWDEQNYLAETDENDDTQVVYTNEPRRYGNLVSQRRGSDPHWYHFDAIGSTRELTDVSETVTDTRLYDAWGLTIASGGSTPLPCEFIGRLGYLSESDSAVYYIRQRYYSPQVVRWLSADPVQYRRRYTYSQNSPVMVFDPTGLFGCKVKFRCLLHSTEYDVDKCDCICTYECTPIDAWDPSITGEQQPNRDYDEWARVNHDKLPCHSGSKCREFLDPSFRSTIVLINKGDYLHAPEQCPGEYKRSGVIRETEDGEIKTRVGEVDVGGLFCKPDVGLFGCDYEECLSMCDGTGSEHGSFCDTIMDQELKALCTAIK